MSQRFEAQKFSADGNLSASGTALLVVSTFCSAVVLGILAGIIHQWLYLVFLFPILIGALVGGVAVWAIRLGHLRNSLIAGVVSLLAGCIAMFAMHFYDYMQFKSSMQSELDALPPNQAEVIKQLPHLVATRNQQPAEIQAIIAELESHPMEFRALLVHDFLSYMDYEAHVGVSIKSTHNLGEKEGMHLGYEGTYIYWASEVVIVAGFAFYIGMLGAKQPYCNLCSNWKTRKELGIIRGPSEDARSAIEQGNLDLLSAIGRSASAGGLVVRAATCPKCGADSSVDVELRQVTKTKKGDHTKILCHVTYPGSAISVLEQIFASKPPLPTIPPTSRADGVQPS